MNAYDFPNIPSHACSYCRVSHQDCVVQCSSRKCNLWFCNTKYPGSKKSHIMNHIYKSRHNTIRDFYHRDFKCQACSERNIFLLKINVKKYIIYCNKCIKKKNSNQKINHRRWQPFIMEHRLPYQLIPKPFEEDYKKMRILNLENINGIENSWKRNLFSRYDILNSSYENDVHDGYVYKAKNIYENQDDYLKTMRSLLDMHETDCRKRVDEYYQEDVALVWAFPYNRSFILNNVANYDYFSGSLKKGSYLVVTFPREDHFSFEAIITFIDNNKGEIVGVLLDEELKIPVRLRRKSEILVHVQSKWIGESLERMANALRKLQQNPTKFFKKINHFFWVKSDADFRPFSTNRNDKLINPLKIDISASSLNKHQKSALLSSLNADKSPISLIQGPPGTGKTKLIYEIINQICQWNLKEKKANLKEKANLRVLFCAPSNIAVDNLAIKLMENKIEFIRIYSRIREQNDEIEQLLQNVSLHTLARKKAGFKHHSRLPNERKYNYYETENKILKAFNIICCTCSCVGDKRFSNIELFDYVIIDEAAQSLEMETLIPLNHCKTKLVLVGDHKQLGPLVFSNFAKSKGLGISLFERLINSNLIEPVFLASQYRMHQRIAEFPSNTFYEGRIETSVTREIDRSIPWPNLEIPIMFYDINGKEEIGPRGTSFLNMAEAEFVKKTIDMLLQIKKKPENIGIITPYLAQKNFLLNEMNIVDQKEKDLFAVKDKDKRNRNIYEGIVVNSIDGFQGKEKDYIIISCVRSNDELGVGFLHDMNRVNVALTRAKYGLIICGNVNTLKRNEIWGKIIDYYREKGVLVMDS